jgi:hypothetical protein
MANQPSTFPEVVVADMLVAAGVTFDGTALAKGTNLFHFAEAPPKPSTIPHKSVFCIATGGPPPRAYMGNSSDFREFTVQVSIRGEPGKGVAARTCARACWAALQRGTTAATGYIAVYVREPDPVPLSKDGQDHPRFVLNARLWFKG